MPKLPYWILASFLLLSFVLGASKVYEFLPPQCVGITIALGTILFITLYIRVKSFRGFFEEISTSELILCHCIRVPIGGAFLFFGAEEMLPDLFAKNAGYGDIVTGFLGFICVVLVTYLKFPYRYTFLLWSIIGIIDLFQAVGTGLYLATTIAGSMDWITRLPLILVPVVILPFLFGTHFIVAKRLLNNQDNMRIGSTACQR